MAVIDEPLMIARRIASFGLPAVDRDQPAFVSAESWPRLLRLLRAERLTGLAVAATEDGSLELATEQKEQLLDQHLAAMLRSLALERKLLAITGIFREAEVDFVVLKGPVLAHRVYPSPSWRPFGDLDLLVTRQDWRRACAALGAHAFRRMLPEPRPGFDERFGKAVLYSSGEGLPIDLHRTLVLGPFGLWMDPGELFEGKVSFPLAGETLWRLSDTALLLHACMHAVLGWRPPLLLTLRDVVQVAQEAKIDWELLSAWMRRWRLGCVLQHAFQVASETLGADPPEEARSLLSVRSHAAERWALDAHTSERRAQGGVALATLLALPGPRAKAAYLRALLVPDREFLVARSGNRAPTYRHRWEVAIKWLTARYRRA